MAKMLTVGLTLKGDAALLMHSERLVNQFDPLVKQIKSINAKGTRKKTEEDALRVQRLEWEAGMYHSEKIGPYIPGANIKKMLLEAAMAFRGGMAIRRGLLPCDAEIPLIYRGPRDLETMWAEGTYADIRSVGLNKNKVLRCRPRFNEWGLETSVLLNTSVLDLDLFQRYIVQAGRITGLGDYRPTFGRFSARIEVLEENEIEDGYDMNEEDSAC